MHQSFSNYSPTTSAPQAALQLDQMAARRASIPPRTGSYLSGEHACHAWYHSLYTANKAGSATKQSTDRREIKNHERRTQKQQQTRQNILGHERQSST